ncbi:AAA family ATPase [Microbacterium trichothecenolyticum]|uniref:AAA family ATPase n=1 Tax=Microbacterium trichothecenolyticum TaxID=69370 RepID=UPI001C6F3483|nr:AAA family ATPase [Microbacterium trichothecenolyticum]MBW9121320.1 AAA family ATPase [Microbacterium trichothecenolyticum]
MRLHRLELTGFGPFREKQSVDFEAFEHDGIFLIAGRTGAGKSSILDGVCFALYGSVPRYETGDKRLRSDHCEPEDPTEVRLEFTVGDRRWRVTRAPEYQRPARRGGGLTTEPTRAELEELVDGVWIGRAAKPRDVGLFLDDVLGLNAQQFQQVILLAQNRFSRFLLASGTERQSLLRALFGTRRYEEYARELGERSKAAQHELDALGERARTLLDQAARLIVAHELVPADEIDGTTEHDLAARRAAVDLGESRAAYRLDTLTRERVDADDARTAAEAAHGERVALAKAQAELGRARERLAALEAAGPQIADDRRRLDRGRSAEVLRAPLETARRADRTAAATAELAASADAVWARAVSGTDDADTDDLPAVVERLTGELAVWTAALAQEAALADGEAQMMAAAADAARLEADIVALDAQRAQVPAELERLDAELEAEREAASRRDPARVRHDEISARLTAAVKAEGLADAQREAELLHRDAAAAAAAAAAKVAALLQLRLDGYAGELASTLVDGEPCAVCGATAHPCPATPADEPVTDEILATAEARRDAASRHERAASDEAKSARERHAAAAARSGGESAGLLREQLAAAAADLAAAERAVERRDALAARRTGLAALDLEAETSRAALAEQLAGARTRIAALQERVTAARAAVEAARGEHASVADRVAHATSIRDAGRAAVVARTDAQRAATLATQARADADDRIAASVFADAADVTAALIAPGEMEALTERISAHDAQFAAARARMLELELELAGAPAEPVDTEQSQNALAAADAARTAALRAESDARTLVAGLRDLAMHIDQAYAGVAARAADAAAIARLADTVAGRAPNTMKMDLETFVLAAELEEIVTAANLRLSDMSSGRYRLQHTDARAARGAASGLGLEVMDAFTGQSRPAQSLSGGETFLASLALALGLAEVVTARAGGVRLDTLFVDEGFGSLDEETLDLAMRTLDELRQGGRTAGVISHVAAMKEQVPAQLAVEATPAGPSIIRQDSGVRV